MIPKLNLDLVPKSCTNNQNQVLWRIRIRKVRFPKLILHCGLEAFVDICFIIFFEASGSANWIYRFSPKIRQIRCKPGCLEDKDPKPEPGFRAPKSCEKHSKPGSLEDPDSKIRFPTLILHRGLDSGFCRHLSHPFSWSIRIRNLNL